MPKLVAITLYPLKSFSGQSVRSSRVQPSGALEHDRQFALRDPEGAVWNAKRTPLIHGLRTFLSTEHRVLTLHTGEQEHAWHLDRDRSYLETWFSAQLQGPVRFEENDEVGFPDDLESPGPTVVTTASLEAVMRWFPSLTIDEVRQRFRANLEIDGVPAFWEDRLVRDDGSLQPFRIGAVVFGGVNPCQRCVVPTRDPHSAEPLPSFQKTFAERRAATLAAWAPVERFNHFYRFAVNTRLISGANSSICVGDEVELLPPGISEIAGLHRARERQS